MIDFLIKNSLCLSFERAGEKRSQSPGLGGHLCWRHFGGTRKKVDIFNFQSTIILCFKKDI